MVKDLRRDLAAAFERGWRRHGDLYRVRLPGRDLFVGSHPDQVQEVFVDRRSDYQRSSGVSEKPESLELVLGEGLLTSEGARWLERHRLVAPAFHGARIRDMTAQMVSSGRQLVKRLDEFADSDVTIDLHEHIKRATIDVIHRTMFSSGGPPEADRIGPAAEAALRYVARRDTAIVRLPLSWPTIRVRRFKNAMATLDAFIYGLIAERRQTSRHEGDLLDTLLEARNPETGQGLSDVEIRDEVASIYGAGHETTALALTWAWYVLMDEPEVLETLRGEVDELPDDLQPGDLSGLAYTHMVLEETIRLFPPVPVNRRLAVRDSSLAGFDVPEGAVVLIPVTNVHRHPAFWDEPERFEPERFASNGVSGRHKYAYVPFGAGPHLCLGNHFGMTESTLLLAMMARRFVFEPRFERPLPRTVAITLKPARGLSVRVRRR